MFFLSDVGIECIKNIIEFSKLVFLLSSEKMSAKPVQEVVKKVKPLLSLDNVEARRRVIMLYKAWYRAAPEIGKIVIFMFDLYSIFNNFSFISSCDI